MEEGPYKIHTPIRANFDEYSDAEVFDSVIFLDLLTPEISEISERDLSNIAGTINKMSSDKQSPLIILQNLKLKNVLL